MSYLNEEQVNKISNLVREVEKLSDSERLLLYLQLPCGRVELPEGGKYKPNNKQGSDIFLKKPDQETTQTYTWILSHLEEDPNVSLPKQEVYDEYRAFCQANRFEPLCVADFGKAMKHALPCIKPRRLGQRGNSRYCYSGLRKKYRIEPPSLPDLSAVDLHQHQNNNNNKNSSSNNNNNNQGTSSPSKQSHNHSLRSLQSNHHQNQDHQCQAMSSASSSSSSSASSNGSTSAQSNGTAKHNNVMNLKLEPFVENCSAENACCTSQPPSSNGDNCISSHLQHYVDSIHSSPVHQQNHHNQQPQQRLMRPMAGYLSGNVSYHNGQSRYQHSHSAASFQDCLPRTGTPDDDDYRHNYHDLNRPMVGPAIIPFSQSLPAQLAQQPANGNESFISYHSQPIESQVSYSTTQHINNNNHQHANQQQQQPNNMSNQIMVPNCCANETTTTTKSLATNSIPQPQPQPQSQETPCQRLQQSNGTNGTNGTNGMDGTNGMNGTNGTTANNQNHRSPNSQQQQQQLSPCQDQTTPPAIDSSSGNNPAPTTTSPDNKYSTLAQLNLNFMNDPLHGLEIDFASPFQSPTSTPYPMICSNGGGNNYLTQDAQDYYGQTAAVAAGDCNLQYPDQ